MVWYGMVWYGMVWYGMVWYGMVWYGVVWCGMLAAFRLPFRTFGFYSLHNFEATPPVSNFDEEFRSQPRFCWQVAGLHHKTCREITFPMNILERGRQGLELEPAGCCLDQRSRAVYRWACKGGSKKIGAFFESP